MISTNIRDLLTSFSPSVDYLAISSGDGRIKIWDAVKGQLQTDFTDVASDESNWYTKSEQQQQQRGHLSVDYTCITWISLDRKKKRKLGSSLLVLGTGSGDVLALDVSAGQFRWTISDCHPGGVSAISFSMLDSCIYTAGVDGMVCKIDPQMGNLVGKFRASSKAISCISVSLSGRTLATASAQLRMFSCSDHKKIQKFSGHPGAVQSMTFTEDGTYILSSGVGERYIALWRTDGDKKQSASCVLAMEHPPVFLDSMGLFNEEVNGAGLFVLAISETGVCYTWFGRNIEELRNAKPAKASLSFEESKSNNFKGALPTIFAAKLQGSSKEADTHVFIAYGSPVKPLFQNIVVHSGSDIVLKSSQDGVLLPMSQALIKSKKGIARTKVTALDRANVEDALLPIPKVSDFHEKKASNKIVIVDDHLMADLVDGRNQDKPAENKVIELEKYMALTSDDKAEVDTATISIEKQLRLLNVLDAKDDSIFDLALLKGIDLGEDVPQKQMRASVLSMGAKNAFELLEVLVHLWQSRSCKGKTILRWIHCILVNHGHNVMTKKKSQILDSLLKITKFRGEAIQPLLQLSGRLQLVSSQIDKDSATRNHPLSHNDQMNENEDDEDVEENFYGDEDDESQLSSDDDN